MKEAILDEIRLFLASLRTTEGALFVTVFAFTMAHLICPGDVTISKAMDAFTGALLLSLRATRQPPQITQPTQNTP